MCMLCHCGDDGEKFLSAFEDSRTAMKRAIAAIHTCSGTALHPVTRVPYHEARTQYDRMHKKMVRLLREWNKIEQEREQVNGGTHVQ